MIYTHRADRSIGWISFAQNTYEYARVVVQLREHGERDEVVRSRRHRSPGMSQQRGKYVTSGVIENAHCSRELFGCRYTVLLECARIDA